MLNALRRGAKTGYAKILIAVLVLSFALWGVADFVNQVDPTEVASAGSTPVSAAEFARFYERALRSTSEQLGRGLTADQAAAVGLPDQVLQTLVTDALQVDAADRLGVDLGDEMLAERIRTDEVFAGADGRFDRQRFDQLLAQNRYTESEFIALQRKAATREMLVNGLIGGLAAPEPYLEALYRFRNQSRQVDWFALSEDSLGAIADPTEEELRTFYEENRARFRAPEFRELALVSLSAETLARPESVDEAEIRKRYEVAGAYGTPERRRVQQVIMDDPELARKAADAINGGAAFEAILTELGRSFRDVDLGLVTRDELADPAVAEAAFALEPREAAAVDGRFGPVLVRVGEVQPGAKRPFEEVKDEIARTLAVQEAERQVRDVYGSIEDAFAGGATVAEVAERFDLPVRTVTVDRRGVTPEGTQPEIDNGAGVLETAFRAEAGDDALPTRGGDVTTWVQVTDVIEATDRPFEEVQGEVLVAWTEAQKKERLDALAAEALAAVEAGQPVAEVAARYGATAATAPEVSRAEPPQDLPEPAVSAAFEGGEGHVARVADGERQIILKVVDVNEPAFFAEAADVRPISRALNEGLANTLLFEFVSAWQEEVGATVNRPVLDQVIGLDRRSS